jgi:hypothetical protein
MRSPVVLAALAALALPAAAGAKEITALDVCGTDGCTRIADRSVLRGFEQGSELAEAPPAGRHRSYLLRIRIRDEAGAARTGWTSLWIPSAHLIAFDDGQPGATFTPAPPALERALWSGAPRHPARGGGRVGNTPPEATQGGRRDASPLRAPLPRASRRSSRRRCARPLGRAPAGRR